MPFSKSSDNFFAAVCSLLLTILFICCTFYKFSALTQLEDLQRILSDGQKADYMPPQITLTAVIFGACVGAIIVLALLMVSLSAAEVRRSQREARLSKARRLMRVIKGKGMEEVHAPSIDPRGFHLFLSHVWSSVRIDQDLSPSRSLDPRTSGRATHCSALPST